MSPATVTPERVLATITRSTEAMALAEQARDQSIVMAITMGLSARAVAKAAGLTHPTVTAIVARAGVPS